MTKVYFFPLSDRSSVFQVQSSGTVQTGDSPVMEKELK